MRMPKSERLERATHAPRMPDLAANLLDLHLAAAGRLELVG
jgi:hypothetical protein